MCVEQIMDIYTFGKVDTNMIGYHYNDNIIVHAQTCYFST